MTKLWLAEGFCPEDRYHCLMPVAYTSVKAAGSEEIYVKEKMACRHAQAGICMQAEDCVFLKNAPEKLEKNANWYEV